MFCPNCGSEMKDGAVFCGNCGFKLDKSSNANLNNAPVKNKIRKKSFLGRFVKFLIFLIVVAGALFAYCKYQGIDIFDFVESKYLSLFDNQKHNVTEEKKPKEEYSGINVNNAKNSWIEYNGHDYHTDDKGNIEKNKWVGVYYLDNDGKVLKNAWSPVFDGHKYYLGEDGKYQKNKWIQSDDDWYYLDNNGHMLTDSWVDNKYYVDNKGKMVKNRVYNGIEFDENGLSKSSRDLTSQINNKKSVLDYPVNTLVDQMDTISLGKYEQDGNAVNGPEPIEWIIVAKGGNEALLVSKYILDNQSYNITGLYTTWENSTLRAWLNDSFYKAAFSDEDKNHIVTKLINNNKNLRYPKANSGNDTVDNVFLLSIDECGTYFGAPNLADCPKLATRGTNYAKTTNNRGGHLTVRDKNDWAIGNSQYWLRSTGASNSYAASIMQIGGIDLYGNMSDLVYLGVRPAIWVKY